MRYIHFIFAFIASIVVSACTTTDIDVHIEPVDTPTHGGDLQVVGRITQYSDCDVATRSKKEGDESKVTSMGLALFPIENGTIGNCLYYDFKLGGSIVFIVDRKDKVFDEYANKEFAMYIFANMQGAEGFPTTKDAGVGKSLDYFTKRAVAASANVEGVPTNGFPMVGSLGNTLTIDGIESDGKALILKPTATNTNVDGLPLVDGTPTDNLEIPLKSMYAKFSFTISVKPDQEIVGNKAPRFDLLSYEVKNIAAEVDSNSGTNDSGVIASSGKVSMGNYAQGATVAEFDFYLPERYLSPSKALDDVLPTELKKKEGTYGTDVDADQNGYRDEDERYHQRYKNLLVEGTDATHVIINGKYTDHQGHAYDVAYKIFLGGNNRDNFNVIRNTHYDNSVTIRGIANSSDQATNTDGISIDWRVEVDRSTPLVINLRRESLLDAHYEVRPLRLRLVGENIPTGTSATVSILNQDGKTTSAVPDWIRLEASGNTGAHITTEGVSKGKRKYFTTDLVTETLKNGTSITVNNLSGANQTLWIYVDENTTTVSRAAIVRVSYNGVDKDYKIVQHGLFEVTSTDGKRTYYIEQYEEYLYNYDAEDSYGQTKQEGMPWGLENTQLSSEHESFTINETNSAWTGWVDEHPNILTYDFYIKKHDDSLATASGAKKIREYAGQEFTAEIFTKSKGGVKVLTMADQASGAVEYCYNRNKRDENGNVVKVEWYLPSADELEDFIVPAYASFEEFQNNYYWTSQPAYIRNAFYYQYFTSAFAGSAQDAYSFTVYEDNKEYARATKVISLGNDQYDYAKSGLNDIPNDPKDRETIPSNEQSQGTIELGYFNVWHHWSRRSRLGSPSYEKRTVDQVYRERINNQDGKRYYAFLPHLLDMAQEGYHQRTKSNRVRCVRKK